eukprot:3244495-Amphidinium_carterae.1
MHVMKGEQVSSSCLADNHLHRNTLKVTLANKCAVCLHRTAANRSSARSCYCFRFCVVLLCLFNTGGVWRGGGQTCCTGVRLSAEVPQLAHLWLLVVLSTIGNPTRRIIRCCNSKRPSTIHRAGKRAYHVPAERIISKKKRLRSQKEQDCQKVVSNTATGSMDRT